jgi:hypothetical protein
VLSTEEKQTMEILCKSRAARQYRRQFLMAMVAYVAALSFAVHFTVRHHPGGMEAYGVAILPAVPVLGIIVIVGIYLADEQDEYQRTVLVQSMMWSMGLTLATLTVWGFLEVFANIAHFQPYLAFPLFWGFVGATSPFIRMRYR